MLAVTVFVAATVPLALAAPASRARAGAIPPASHFSATVDNVWFPLRPVARYIYAGGKGGLPSRDVVTVSHRVRTIAGVPCAVVFDRLYLRCSLRERTTD